MSYALVIPVYRNEENIALLLDAVSKMSQTLGEGFEAIFVIDGSPDDSGRLLLERTPTCAFRSKIIFHSRNFGAFAAIRTGMELASATYVGAMAADLQEPPALIIEAFRLLSANEADVVFGQRDGRDDPAAARMMSNLFWSLYRRYILKDMPKGGVDIFACNKAVRDAVLSIVEPNSSLIAQLFWVGFRRAFVPYVRRKRVHGTSAWNFSRRFRYMMDSVFSFSDLPIMLVLWLGLFGCTLSVVLGVITLIAKLSGYIQEAGYTSLFLVIVFFGSLILSVQGILGCYIWRTAENTKRRPLRIIRHVVECGYPEQMRRVT